MPAPIIAPIPSVTRLTGPSARFRQCSPVSAASRINTSIGLVANSGLPMQRLLWRVTSPRLPPTAKLDASIVGAQHAAPLQLNLYDARRAVPEIRDQIRYTGRPNSTITRP